MSEAVVVTKKEPTVVHMLTCNLQRNRELREILDRALNTIPYDDWPEWVQQLDRAVTNSEATLAAGVDE